MAPMIANYRTNRDQEIRSGIVLDGGIVDLEDIAETRGIAPRDLYREWDRIERALAAAPDEAAISRRVAEVELLPPSLEPSAIYFAGFNYRDHVANMKKMFNLPDEPDPRDVGLDPWHNLKPRNALCGDGTIVTMPARSQRVDWEVELAVVIGRTVRNVPVADALAAVAGYTVAIDLSARDLAFRPHTPVESVARMDWLAQKGWEGACPLGPWLAPGGAIRDPQRLALRLSVNGVVKQDSSTANMIFSVAESIAHLSSMVTLSPGDIILTGTPAGTGAERGEFLKPRDVVTASVEAIGEIRITMA